MWMLVILLAFLIPYVRNYYDRKFLNEDNWFVSIGMFLLGIIAGDSRETVICWIILILSYWLFRSFKKDNAQRWKFAGLFGLCVGYAVLIFAPGNISRLQMQQNTDSVIIANELLRAKSVEFIIILLFHFIIWYFIVSFIFKYKRRKEKFIHKDTPLYLNIARLLVLIACGSAIMMFFIPSSGLRPSFLNLVCLIIASALLFRLQEVNDVYVIDDRGKHFLQFVGCAYLTVTIVFSVWGNYINYSHLQNILISVKEAGKQSSKVVLEVSPSLTSQNNIWIFGSGFHLVPLPVHEDENHEINKTFSYYYGIKGIKIRK
jgi:predicted permease